MGGFLAGDELNIIHQKQIRFPIFTAKFDVLSVFDGVDQFICELVALDVDDVGVGIFLADAVGDCIEQVGLAHAGGAVDEQGVIDLSRGLGNGNGGGVSEAVAWAHHKIIEGKLRIKVHGGGILSLGLPGVQFLVAEHQKLCVGVEDLLQRVLNEIGAPASDDLPAEIRGRIENQVIFVQLHHLRVVQPRGNGHGPQPLLQTAQDLCPDIGG